MNTSILPINITSALGAAAPYLPYICAGALTITAIAIIYLAYTRIYALSPSTNQPKPEPQTETRPKPQEGGQAPDPSPLPQAMAAAAIDQQAAKHPFHALFEIPNLKSMPPQRAMSQMEIAFKEKLVQIESHEEVEALVEAFFQNTKALFHEKQLQRQFFPRLAGAFEDLWLHPSIDVSRLPVLLGTIGCTNQPKLVESGIGILKEALAKAASFKEAMPIAMCLEALGPIQEVHLTALAIKENIAFEPKSPLCQGALKLHQTLRALAETEILNVTTLAQAATQHQITPDQAIIQEIKGRIGDEEKTKGIWTYTKAQDNPFNCYFSKPELKEILTEDLGALSLHIDNSYEKGHALYNLANIGEMDRMIQMTIWLDLLSRAAGAGPRKFSTTMHETTDAEIAQQLEYYD